MAKKPKIFPQILPENLQVEWLSDWVETQYGYQIEERYLKKLATDCKGNFTLFASRLQGHVCNLRFEENAKLYPDWPQGFAELLKKAMEENA